MDSKSNKNHIDYYFHIHNKDAYIFHEVLDEEVFTTDWRTSKFTIPNSDVQEVLERSYKSKKIYDQETRYFRHKKIPKKTHLFQDYMSIGFFILGGEILGVGKVNTVINTLANYNTYYFNNYSEFDEDKRSKNKTIIIDDNNEQEFINNITTREHHLVDVYVTDYMHSAIQFGDIAFAFLKSHQKMVIRPAFEIFDMNKSVFDYKKRRFDN